MFATAAPTRLKLPILHSAKANLNFTPLGFGSVPIANYVIKLTDETAYATIKRALTAGIRVFDTAPLYGYGLSETRLGVVFKSVESQIPRQSLFITSKVGRILVSDPGSKENSMYPGAPEFIDRFDYTYKGIQKSIQSSLARLQTTYLDVAHVHDLGKFAHEDPATERQMLKDFIDSGYKALLEYREQGVIKAIGLGVNECEIALELMQSYNIDFDCIMLAQRYNLLEQAEKTDEFFAECEKRGIAVMIGAPLSSGILSGDPQKTTFCYTPAPQDILTKKQNIEAICKKHDVSLLQASLHFPLLQPSVKTVAMGARAEKEIEQAVHAINLPVPAELWEELKQAGLITYPQQAQQIKCKL